MFIEKIKQNFREKKIFYALAAVFAIFMIASSVVAFSRTAGAVETYFQWGDGTIDGTINTVVSWLAGGVGVAVLGGIIYGAILYATASGNASQTAKAIGVIRNSVIALILFFGAGNILSFITGGATSGYTGGGASTLFGQTSLMNGVAAQFANKNIIGGISVLAMNILNLATFVVGVVAVVFIIWGGFQYLISAGDPAKATKARQTITHAITGLIIGIVGNVLIKIIEAATGGSVSTDKIASVSVPTITLSLSSILNQVYLIAGIIAVVMLIWAGIQLITSNGDPNKAKTGRQNIMYALIGLAVIILAYAITNFVITNITGTDVSSVAKNITDIGFLVVGILAVIMIIVSALRLIGSAGDPAKAKTARTSLMYSMIGVVVAVFAYAAVTYVINQINGN